MDATQIAVLDLQTGSRKVVLRGGTDARYVPSGHLVYGSAGTLWAVAFDLRGLETRGTPVPIVAQVAMTGVGAAEAAVSSDGTMGSAVVIPYDWSSDGRYLLFSATTASADDGGSCR